MNTGKLVRMNRIFSHSSGRVCTIAVDHLIGLRGQLPSGLRPIQATLAEIVSAVVLAGELSLMAAFTTSDLASAHEKLGRGGTPPKPPPLGRQA